MVERVRALHAVLPGNVDDPDAPSGGNTYDRHVCQGLAASGWSVRRIAIRGAWPRPGNTERAELARSLAAVPDDAVVLLDGLVACGVPDIIVAESGRLRLVVLVHLPLGDETALAPAEAAELSRLESGTLRAADRVVATSTWTRRRLIERHGLDPARVHVATPGVEAAPLAPGTDGASQLLCVASVTPTKGHDVLVEALATIGGPTWNCVCVGALGRAPDYVERLRRLTQTRGLADRVELAGPRTGGDLAATYAAADLVVLASRVEAYGMVVTEALARGIPVLATEVDGVPGAMGHAPDGSLPGMLVPAGDPGALAVALRRWLGEPELRRRLRSSALARRTTLDGWDVTSRSLGDVLDRVSTVTAVR